MLRSDLQRIRDELTEIAEQEATRLYRLAWRMTDHGCSRESIEACRNEARLLHMCAYPERILSDYQNLQYAFKI